MALVHGGSFEWDHKHVTLGALCVDRREVTSGAYRPCVAEGACAQAGCPGGVAPSHPIACVSRDAASGYCARLGRRLPTAAEFAWLLRGGARNTKFPWGSDGNDSYACVMRAHTCPVASFPRGRTPEGIHDLVGNVEEWVTDESGATIAMGASYIDSLDDLARVRNVPAANGAVGFRCVARPRT